MSRSFNVTGSCDPQIHYMVDIIERVKQIKQLIDKGNYFTINRARQYGKTTTIKALIRYLREEYIVISLDFQRIGNAKFATEHTFSLAFANYLKRIVNNKKSPIVGLNNDIIEQIIKFAKEDELFAFDDLFPLLSDLCDTAKKPVVMIIDEVDSAINNQVFLDFLAQIRSYYLDREISPTFQSVILAGVYDVKNIKRKLRPKEEHKVNSPWNIATDFKVDMSFSKEDIEGMLKEYESDHHTGINTEAMAKLIFDYTSGYPFLVSRICKLIDEEVTGKNSFLEKARAWTKRGFLEAVKMLLSEKNTLFESLIGKLQDYPGLRQLIFSLLFGGEVFVYNPDESWIDMATMFGFIRNNNGRVEIANRIFEMRLYNYFLATTKSQSNKMFQIAAQSKTQFIQDSHLDMELVLQKFVEHFESIYGKNPQKFNEEEGRRRFLLYLRPIINGEGNYYIEAQTRDAKRMDIVVDYHGEQFVIELKIWRGNSYHERGEKQLADYLDYFHLKKGYMLSYNFNKKKEVGMKKMQLGDRVLIEAVI